MSKVMLALVIAALVALMLCEVYEFAGFFLGFVARNVEEGGLATVVFVAIIGLGLYAERLWREEFGP